MKTLFRSFVAIGAASALVTACVPGPVNDVPDAGPGAKEVVEVPAELTGDTTWTADKEYLIKQNTFVTSGSLTIEPGTVIKGQDSSALIITRNARIVAEGTREAPIVMTSAKVEGERENGNWGGLVMLGRGALNVAGGEQAVEGLDANDARALYGGGTTPDNTHDCGSLRYVRIEFAGFVLSGDNETNGLTLGACGIQTKVDYVQVHKGSDDGVEVFGGAVNLKHLVISQGWDDSLDWDLGWTGKAQFVVIQLDPVQGNYGLEADSNGSTPKQAPVSNPELYNFTLVGTGKAPSSKEQAGMLLREGTGARMSNFILTGFPSYSIDVAGQATIEQSFVVAEDQSYALKPAAEQQLYVRQSLFWHNGYDASGALVDGGNVFAPVEPPMVDGKLREKGDIAFDQAAFFTHPAYENLFDVDPQLSKPLDLTAPDFAPKAGSAALTGGATPPDDGFFDTTATFRGAIGTTDWTEGWTAYPAN